MGLLDRIEAVLQLPDLEVLTAVLRRHGLSGCRKEPGALRALLMICSVAAATSENNLSESINHPVIWSHLRAVAAANGRELPAKAGSADQLHHVFYDIEPADFLDADELEELSAKAAADLARSRRLRLVFNDLSEAFTGHAVSVAFAVGLLPEHDGTGLATPPRESTVMADGTTVAPMTAADVAKPSERRISNKGRGDKDMGIPFAAAGVRGANPMTRIILGIDLIEDQGESGTSLQLIDRVLQAADGRVQAVLYDRLWQGAQMSRPLVDHGAVPMVGVRQEQKNRTAVELPHALQIPKVVQSIVGKGKVAKFKKRSMGTVTCDCGDRTALFAVGHALVGVEDGADRPYLDAKPATLQTIERRHRDGQWELTATWTVIGFDCGHDIPFVKTFGGPTAKHDLNGLHLLPQVDPRYAGRYGERNDIESTFRWIKAMLGRDDRATRMKIDRYLIDVLGASVLSNAQTWVAHHARASALAA